MFSYSGCQCRHRRGSPVDHPNGAEVEASVGGELLDPTHGDRREDLVTARARGRQAPPGHGRIVLAVDERDDLHPTESNGHVTMTQ